MQIVAALFWLMVLLFPVVFVILARRARRAPKVSAEHRDGREFPGPFGGPGFCCPGLEAAHLAEQAFDPMGRPAGWIPLGEGQALHHRRLSKRFRDMGDFRHKFD